MSHGMMLVDFTMWKQRFWTQYKYHYNFQSFWQLDYEDQVSLGSSVVDRGLKIFRQKRGLILKKDMNFELSPLIAWIALWIVNIFSKFQVNILSNNRYYKMSTMLTTVLMTMTVIAITRVFSEKQPSWESGLTYWYEELWYSHDLKSSMYI